MHLYNQRELVAIKLKRESSTLIFNFCFIFTYQGCNLIPRIKFLLFELNIYFLKNYFTHTECLRCVAGDWEFVFGN